MLEQARPFYQVTTTRRLDLTKTINKARFIYIKKNRGRVCSAVFKTDVDVWTLSFAFPR